MLILPGIKCMSNTFLGDLCSKDMLKLTPHSRINLLTSTKLMIGLQIHSDLTAILTLALSCSKTI